MDGWKLSCFFRFRPIFRCKLAVSFSREGVKTPNWSCGSNLVPNSLSKIAWKHPTIRVASTTWVLCWNPGNKNPSVSSKKKTYSGSRVRPPFASCSFKLFISWGISGRNFCSWMRVTFSTIKLPKESNLSTRKKPTLKRNPLRKNHVHPQRLT